MVRRLEEHGRSAEADEQMEKALKLDPESWEVNKEAGRLRRLRGDIQGATAFYEKAVELMESDFHAWALLITFYQAQQDRENVLRAARMMVSQAEKAIQQDPSNGAALGIIAGGFAALGEPDRAREWIDRAMLIDPDNLTMRYNFACVLAAHLHDKEGALKLLERTLSVAGEMELRMAETDPDFKSLRDDERFQQILNRAAMRLRGGKAATA
jgi:adenylate cyclase